jgi:hypothetical protein
MSHKVFGNMTCFGFSLHFVFSKFQWFFLTVYLCFLPLWKKFLKVVIISIWVLNSIFDCYIHSPSSGPL